MSSQRPLDGVLWPALLVAVTLATFSRVSGGGSDDGAPLPSFVDFDDPSNFVGNAHVQHGLALADVAWAFRDGVVLWVYEPVALLAKMLACSAIAHANAGGGGGRSGGGSSTCFEHAGAPRALALISLALHLGAALLAYGTATDLVAALLARGGGGGGGRARSGGGELRAAERGVCAGAVLLVFGAHPLRAEVLGWASCLPYTLAALFAAGAVRAQLRGAHRLAFACYTLACLSKIPAVSALVCLPAASWLGQRRRGKGGGSGGGSSGGERAAPLLLLLLRHFAPHAAVALFSVWRALLATRGIGRTVIDCGERAAAACALGFGERALRAPYIAVWGLVKTAWPAQLAVRYVLPRRALTPAQWPIAAAAVIALCLTAVSAWRAAECWRHRRAGARAGWLDGVAATWVAYCAVLSPALGLVGGEHLTMLTGEWSRLEP